MCPSPQLKQELPILTGVLGSSAFTSRPSTTPPSPLTTSHSGENRSTFSHLWFYYKSHHHDQSDLFTCLHLVLGTITVYLEGVVGGLLPSLEIRLQLLLLFLESDVLGD